jgi:hypothetical protein
VLPNNYAMIFTSKYLLQLFQGRKEAMRDFPLAASDLDSVLPIERRESPWGGEDLQTYNLIDVYALVVRVLTPAPVHPNDPNEISQRNGRDILRTDAMELYDVWSISMLIFVTTRA